MSCEGTLVAKIHRFKPCFVTLFRYGICWRWHYFRRYLLLKRNLPRNQKTVSHPAANTKKYYIWPKHKVICPYMIQPLLNIFFCIFHLHMSFISLVLYFGMYFGFGSLNQTLHVPNSIWLSVASIHKRFAPTNICHWTIMFPHYYLLYWSPHIGSCVIINFFIDDFL